MSPPPGVHPGGHPASDAMYGTTTAADATMNERYFSLYAKGKTPPGSSTPAAEARDAGDDAPPHRKWNHLPLDSIRAEFPALTDANHDGWAFMENAGGSQVPRRVADAVHHYMCNNYVQLGAGYPHSDRADATVHRAHQLVKTFAGVRPCSAGGAGGEVILGSSSTQLLATLASCFDVLHSVGDEIVVQRAGHEANIGPWVNLSKRSGAKLSWWYPGPNGGAGEIADLEQILTKDTKIVALCHVSNLLGEIIDLPRIVELIRSRAARDCQIIVDGVAFAPHRPIEVDKWGVDWYAFSPYKVYGPHVGALFGSAKALELVTGPNHYFINPKQVPYKFELGGCSHEACAGLVAMGGYLRRLVTGVQPNDPSLDRAPDDLNIAGDLDPTRAECVAACEYMTRLEQTPQTVLAGYLSRMHERGFVRVIGPLTDDPNVRVPTFSFVPTTGGVTVASVVAAAHASKIAIRSGNMYGVRLLEDLNIDPEVGVVRVSLVHYNTEEEVAALITALNEVLLG